MGQLGSWQQLLPRFTFPAAGMAVVLVLLLHVHLTHVTAQTIGCHRNPAQTLDINLSSNSHHHHERRTTSLSNLGHDGKNSLAGHIRSQSISQSELGRQRRLMSRTSEESILATEPSESPTPLTSSRTSGSSYNNPTNLPLPAGYQPVISATHRVLGQKAIDNRVKLEKAYGAAFSEVFDPLNIQIRWLNFTVYPKASSEDKDWSLAGDFRAIDYEALIYHSPVAAGYASNLTMGSVFQRIDLIQRTMALKYGVRRKLVVLRENALTETFLKQQRPFGEAKTIIELTGAGLLPFTFEKQNAMLESLYQFLITFAARTSYPVFSADLRSSGIENPKVNGTVNTNTKQFREGSLQRTRQQDVVRAVVLTGLQPVKGIKVEALWNDTFSKAVPQQVFVLSTDQTITVASTFRNFTASTIYISDISVTGRYVSSQQYEVNNIKEGLLDPDVKPGPPATSQLSPLEDQTDVQPLPGPALESDAPVDNGPSTGRRAAPPTSELRSNNNAGTTTGISFGTVVFLLLVTGVAFDGV